VDMGISSGSNARKARSPKWWRVRKGLADSGTESELRRRPILAAAEYVESAEATRAAIHRQGQQHPAGEGTHGRRGRVAGRGPCSRSKREDVHR
jgi:hypothetical protein